MVDWKYNIVHILWKSEWNRIFYIHFLLNSAQIKIIMLRDSKSLPTHRLFRRKNIVLSCPGISCPGFRTVFPWLKPFLYLQLKIRSSNWIPTRPKNLLKIRWKRRIWDKRWQHFGAKERDGIREHFTSLKSFLKAWNHLQNLINFLYRFSFSRFKSGHFIGLYKTSP